MAHCGPNYEFIYFDVGCQGRISDGGIFERCSLKKVLVENQAHLPNPSPLPDTDRNKSYHMLRDDTFTLTPYLMKPFPRASQLLLRYTTIGTAVVEGYLRTHTFQVFLNAIDLCVPKVEKVNSFA